MRMPRDRLTRKALVGKFIPPGVDDYDQIDWLRSDANVAELEPAARFMPDMLQDRIKHLVEECGLPVEMLHLLFETTGEADARRADMRPSELYLLNKRVFHAATRKWFIQAVAKDWSRGDVKIEEQAADELVEKYFGSKNNPGETREQMRRRAVAQGADLGPEEVVRMYYRPPRTGIEEPFYGGQCKWCGQRFGRASEGEIWCEPTRVANVPEALKLHLKECHAVFTPDEEEIKCRQELVKVAKERDAERGKQIRSDIIGRYTSLSEVRKTGPRRAGRVTHVPKIKCRLCKTNFTSSAGAMELHAQAHLRDDYIKNSQ
eukprot:g5035.t1